MARLQINSSIVVETDSLVKVAFTPSASAPIGQRADLLASSNEQLVPAVPNDVEVNGLSILQQLRALIGDGTGGTGWVRVRRSGTTGDNEDSYANLHQIGGVEFGQAVDGPIARLKSTGGAEIGEVHLPSAVRVVRSLRPEP